MKKYTYTILLLVTCLIAIPFLEPKILEISKNDAMHAAAFFTQTAKAANTVIQSTDTIEAAENAAEGSPGAVEASRSPAGESPDAAEAAENAAGESPDAAEAAESPAGESPDAAEAAENAVEDPFDAEETFHTVERSYFDDALFIGDSRTVGLWEYADLGEADVFADTGLSVYKAMKDKIYVDGFGKITLENLLQEKTYGKVYIMLGINELGYDFDQTVARYENLVGFVHTYQPDAIVFLEANLHVTKAKSDREALFNNEHIDRFNESIRQLADGKTSYYIDVNSLFDGEDGALNPDLTNDEAHVLGKYYSEWADWILTKGI